MNVYEELRNLDFTREECVEIMSAEEDDFYIATEREEYRFIHIEAIDDILIGELCSDPETLGYFNAWFLTSVLDAPVEIIQALQKTDNQGLVGEWIIERDKVEILAKDYVRAESYGEHFAHYDGLQEEVNNYLMFRIY